MSGALGGTPSVVIVGAGIAGLACARVLHDAGLSPVVLDKGRGPGGRASTRRGEFGAFDHGAQYFTARSAGFCDRVASWAREGVAARWHGAIGRIDAEGRFGAQADRERWVGTPGMNAIVRAMGEGLDVRFGVEVRGIASERDGWTLEHGEGASLHADAVVVAVPPVQAARLLGGGAPALAARAAGARLDPCWTVMAAFRTPVFPGVDGARVSNAGPLGWIARDSSKPGRVRDGVDRWVIQANAAWSASELERDAGSVRDALLDAFLELTGADREDLLGASAHRWRYAAVAEPVGEPCMADADSGLVLCGDWLLDARIEAAYESGTAAGRAMLAALGVA